MLVKIWVKKSMSFRFAVRWTSAGITGITPFPPSRARRPPTAVPPGQQSENNSPPYKRSENNSPLQKSENNSPLQQSVNNSPTQQSENNSPTQQSENNSSTQQSENNSTTQQSENNSTASTVGEQQISICRLIEQSFLRTSLKLRSMYFSTQTLMEQLYIELVKSANVQLQGIHWEWMADIQVMVKTDV